MKRLYGKVRTSVHNTRIHIRKRMHIEARAKTNKKQSPIPRRPGRRMPLCPDFFHLLLLFFFLVLLFLHLLFLAVVLPRAVGYYARILNTEYYESLSRNLQSLPLPHRRLRTRATPSSPPLSSSSVLRSALHRGIRTINAPLRLLGGVA